jgi:hypothetical protein
MRLPMLASMIHLWATIRGKSFPVTNSLTTRQRGVLFFFRFQGTAVFYHDYHALSYLLTACLHRIPHAPQRICLCFASYVPTCFAVLA